MPPPTPGPVLPSGHGLLFGQAGKGGEKVGKLGIGRQNCRPMPSFPLTIPLPPPQADGRGN